MSRVIDATLRLTDQFTTPLSHSIKAMTEASREGERMRKSIDKAGQTISQVGGSLTKSVSLPVAGIGMACGKMAVDFENGIAKVSTIADTSVMSLDKIKSGTLDLSNQLGVAVSDISEAQYSAISAGVKTEKSFSMVSTAVKAAKAGFTDTATAVDGLTTVYNSFQGAVDYDKIADQMMMTQNYGKTTFGEMASSIGQVTPIANSLNVSTEELFSSVAVLTKNGISTSSSITGLKAAYSNILKPTSDASKTAKKLGLDFSATHLKAVGWAKFMEEIKEKTNGDADAMASLFGSVEALNSMTVLAGAGAEDFAACLEQMGGAAGLTEESYNKMLTPGERWNIQINKLKNAGIKLGEKLLPVFERITEAVSSVADRFNGLSDSQMDMVIKIAAIAAAVGPLVMVFGKTVSISSKLIGVFSKVKKAGGIVKMAIAAITSPAGIVIAALAAIVAVAILVYKNFDKIKAAVVKLAQKCKPQIDMIKRAFDNIKNAVMNAAAKFEEMKPRAIAAVQAVWNFIQPFVNFLKRIFGATLQGILAAAAGYFEGFSSSIGEIIDGVTTIFSGVIDFITGVFSGDWEQAWDGIVQIFDGIFNSIVGIAKGVINGVSGAINAVINCINGAGFTIPDWVPVIGGNAFEVSIPTIPQLAKGTSNWIGGLAQVSERGGEIIDLPSGSRVYPHDESIRKARAEGGTTLNMPKLADQIIIREQADIDRIADTIVRRVARASRNMGGVSVGDMA